MPRDKTISHEKIICAAMDEFAEYGYDRASMRSIGKRCGLTAAAIYRHFESKEALFDALVGPAFDDINEWMDRHMSDSESAIKDIRGGDPGTASDALWRSTEIDMMRTLVYPRMSEYSLLINRASGSKYEDFMDYLVSRCGAGMRPYISDLKARGVKVIDVSETELSMLIAAYCTALFEPVVHSYSLDEAVRYLSTVETFFMPGWKALLGFA